MCAIYAIKITELIIKCVICCYNVVICCYILGDFPIDAFFAICNLRAQKVLYSAKKPRNAEVVFPDDHDYTTKPKHDYTTKPNHNYTTKPSHNHTTEPSHDYTTKPNHNHITEPSHDYTH